MQLLGFGTTLGIIVQTLALIPVLRRVGFRWRPRWDFRRSEVSEIGRMAGPLFGYIVTTQVAFLVVSNVANKASVHAPYDGPSTYGYAWQLFQMPYAIVGISVITALLPRMSAHAAERRYSLVKSDFSSGVRLSSAIVVPASLCLAVLGAPLAEAVFGYGSTSVAQARYLGLVFGLFALGLVPYMMFQLMLRVFYALHDSRTPMYIGVAVMIANITVSLLSLSHLPRGHVVEGLAVAFGVANLVGAIVAWRILSRRMRGLEGHAIARSLIRMHLAAIPAAIFALAVTFAVGGCTPLRAGVRHPHTDLRRERRGAAVCTVRQGPGGHRAYGTHRWPANQARAMTGPGRGATCPGPSHREVTVCAGGQRGLRPVGMGGLPWCSAPWSVLSGCWSLRGRGRRVEGLPRS